MKEYEMASLFTIQKMFKLADWTEYWGGEKNHKSQCATLTPQVTEKKNIPTGHTARINIKSILIQLVTLYR